MVELFMRARFACVVAMLAAFVLQAPVDAQTTIVRTAAVGVNGNPGYDRYSSSASHLPLPRAALRRVTDARVQDLPGVPYAITELARVYHGVHGPLSGYPAGVNNLGQIAVNNFCQCYSLGFGHGDGGVVMDDTGFVFGELQGPCCVGGGGSATSTPSAINNLGYVAGNYIYSINPSAKIVQGNIVWGIGGAISYFGGADNGSVALGINDNNVSVGQDVGPKGTFASAYEPLPKGGMRRILLSPPKHTSWVGYAYGINDSGVIVGLAFFPNRRDSRAVRFRENDYASVLPVAPAGVDSSAFAINVHGDIVGNAGNRAFLYKNNRVIYLPRPPGETAGKATAYAINANDEIVGDIVSTTSFSTFLYVDGKSYDLESLLPPNALWSLENVSGINDSGQIVGNGFDYNDYQGGLFSMKPQLSATKHGALLRTNRPRVSTAER